MTNRDTITLKLIAALLEAIEVEAARDADQAIKTIRALLEAAGK